MIKGIDVSGIQGIVDWHSVANAGYEFAICKCGNGNDGIDGTYSRNIAGAKTAGLKVAAYHVIYPLQTDPTHPNRDPVGQATMHFNASQGMISCADLEFPAPQNWATWGISAAFINEWTQEYLAYYAQLSGQTPFLYSYPYFFNAVNFTSAITMFPLWIASYTNVPVIPHPYTSWSIWQASGGSITLPGTNIPVDEDYISDPFVLAALS